MRKSRVVVFCVLAGAIAACASARDDSALKSGASGTTALEQPVIRAELLPVAAGTIVDLVRGTAYITRDREAIEIESALALEQDDLLQIHSDSAVLLRSPDGKEIELRREHGEWFRFSIHFGMQDLKAFPQSVIAVARRDLPGIEGAEET